MYRLISERGVMQDPEQDKGGQPRRSSRDAHQSSVVKRCNASPAQIAGRSDRFGFLCCYGGLDCQVAEMQARMD